MTDEIWREIDLERKKKKKKCYREGNKLWFALKFSRCQPIDNLQSTSLAIFESATWNCTTFGEILRPSFDKILGRTNLVATIVTSTQSDPVKLIRIHDIAVWFDFSCPLTTSRSEMHRHYIRWYSSACWSMLWDDPRLLLNLRVEWRQLSRWNRSCHFCRISLLFCNLVGNMRLNSRQR